MRPLDLFYRRECAIEDWGSARKTTAIHWLRDHGMIALVLLFVAISAAIHLHTISIWYDEAITLLTVSGHAQTDFTLGMEQFKPSADLHRITFDLYHQDVHPPLYFWTLAIWRVIWGPSLEAARSLSALFVLGTCLLLYILARLSKMKWPWIPAVIFAVSGVGEVYAWNMRPYAMASFLVVLEYLLAQRRSRWTGLCAAASVATHYFAALCVGPILVLAMIQNWKSDRAWVKKTATTFALGMAPLLLLLRTHLAARPLQYSDFGPWYQELWALLKGSITGVLPSSSLPGWGLTAMLAGGIALLGIRWAWRQGMRSVPLMYLGFVCGFLVLSIVTNKSIAKMPVEYYLGLGVPWLALLVGFGLNARPNLRPLYVVVVAAGMVTAAPLVTSPDYRSLASRIRTACSDCVVVVGNGYAGAVPACILYESRGMKVVTANRGDTPQMIADRAEEQGDRQPVIFVKTDEPPTAKAEEGFLRAYPSAWRGGYFEVFTEDGPTARIRGDGNNSMMGSNAIGAHEGLRRPALPSAM